MESALSMALRIPKNNNVRMSDDVWLLGEAIRQYRYISTPRGAMEAAVRIMADRLASEDPEFAKLVNKVIAEGIEKNE